MLLKNYSFPFSPFWGTRNSQKIGGLALEVLSRGGGGYFWARAPDKLDSKTHVMQAWSWIQPCSGSRTDLIGEPLANGNPLAGILQSKVSKCLKTTVLITDPSSSLNPTFFPHRWLHNKPCIWAKFLSLRKTMMLKYCY